MSSITLQIPSLLCEPLPPFITLQWPSINNNLHTFLVRGHVKAVLVMSRKPCSDARYIILWQLTAFATTM